MNTSTTVLINLTLACVCAASVSVVLFVRHQMTRGKPLHADPLMLTPRVAEPVDGDVDGIALWADDVLAERERATRPDTVGADAWYVDTFGLEQDEREFRAESDLRATLAARHPPP
jgi:hypothetical protein